MGNYADDRLTEIDLRNMLGDEFRFPSDGNTHRLNRLVDDAEELSSRDKMSMEEALRIVSGKARRPYGAPRPR